MLLLAGRKHSADDFIKARLPCNGLCGLLIVSREHHGSESHCLKLADSLSGIALEIIADRDDAKYPVSRQEEKRCLSGFGEALCLFSHVSADLSHRGDELHASALQFNPVQSTFDAVTGKGPEGSCLLSGYTL